MTTCECGATITWDRVTGEFVAGGLEQRYYLAGELVHACLQPLSMAVQMGLPS